jgi:membrane-associated phospholipid phosphatase
MPNFFKEISFCLSLLITVSASAQNIDIDLLRDINPENPNSEVWNISSDSFLYVSGTLALGSLTYGLIAKDKKWKHNGYELLITSTINFASTELLKIAFARARPEDRYPGEIFTNSTTIGYSFPSGHTSQAFAMATTISLQHRKWYVVVPAYLWAGSVGYSRMYLGKHYPSDVLAGAALGVASSYLSHVITKKLFKPKKAR